MADKKATRTAEETRRSMENGLSIYLSIYLLKLKQKSGSYNKYTNLLTTLTGAFGFDVLLRIITVSAHFSLIVMHHIRLCLC